MKDDEVARGQWEALSIANLDVQLYLPATQPRHGSGRALMINLHGCAQKNLDLRVYGNWEGVANHYGMIVAMPQAPGTHFFMPMGSFANRFSGCWDYYGMIHDEKEDHAVEVLNLVHELVANKDLNIDPAQVYVTGFSSGGTLSMIMGCMEPDLIAGVGSNSGPALGSGEADLIVMNPFYPPPFFDGSRVRENCEKLSQGKPGFDTQMASFIHDDLDLFVNYKHSTVNVAGMRELYGADASESFSLSEAGGINPFGSGRYYSDKQGNRISFITNTGMNHAWAAGTISPNVMWISVSSVEYPSYVTDFFFQNNRRITR
ncbi:MAG: PHB depolymerase family esterase [Oligoflexales bacterium]